MHTNTRVRRLLVSKAPGQAMHAVMPPATVSTEPAAGALPRTPAPASSSHLFFNPPTSPCHPGSLEVGDRQGLQQQQLLVDGKLAHVRLTATGIEWSPAGAAQQPRSAATVSPATLAVDSGACGGEGRAAVGSLWRLSTCGSATPGNPSAGGSHCLPPRPAPPPRLQSRSARCSPPCAARREAAARCPACARGDTDWRCSLSGAAAGGAASGRLAAWRWRQEMRGHCRTGQRR